MARSTSQQTTEINNVLNTNNVVTSSTGTIDNVIRVTQAEYDALTPNANTLYVIVG